MKIEYLAIVFICSTGIINYSSIILKTLKWTTNNRIDWTTGIACIVTNFIEGALIGASVGYVLHAAQNNSL